LIIFLSHNSIDLTNDDADADNALARHSAFNKHSRHAEMYREDRDLKMKQPWKHVRFCAAFLKALYPGSVRTLGEWSIEVNNKNKLVYPKKISQRIQLIKDFIAKHNSFAPGTSPLQIFLSVNDIDFVSDLAAAGSAENLHNLFEAASRSKEQEREQRDLLWKPVMKNVRATGAYVKSLFRGKVHEAGDYGFTVDSSKRKPRLRRSVLLGGQSITIKGAAIGRVFTNHGKDVLHLRKLHRASAPPIIISANQQVELPKGYANLTVFNPSDREKGIFSSFYHK
jgi:hypothetical protein